MAFLTFLAWRGADEEALAARIAPQVLRFHVLAESNRPEDQRLKLGVKGLVLDYIRAQAPNQAGKEELTGWIEENGNDIEDMARSWLEKQGKDYDVRLQIVRDYFPVKTYGDMTLPNGTYDAVRITIGKGKGRNWWCMLYPSLCFTDAVHASVPDASQDLLENMLAKEDYEALLPRTTPGQGAAGGVGADGPAEGAAEATGASAPTESAAGAAEANGPAEGPARSLPEAASDPTPAGQKKPEIRVRFRLLELFTKNGASATASAYLTVPAAPRR